METLRKLPKSVLDAVARYYRNRETANSGGPRWNKQADLAAIDEAVRPFKIGYTAIAGLFSFYKGCVEIRVSGSLDKIQRSIHREWRRKPVAKASAS